MGLNLKKSDIVFFDTAPFIYYFEKNPTYFEVVAGLIEDLYRCDAQAITTIITYIELTTQPARCGDKNLVRKYRDYLSYSEHLTLFPLDMQIADQAVMLRAQYGFKTPDAIQLGTALACGADYVITNDKQWRRCPDIAIVLLDELL